MTVEEFFKAYESGERYFSQLYFEYQEGFMNSKLPDIVFEHCFLYVDFRYSDLRRSKFLSCNIKEIDLRECDLTDALMMNCLVESALFTGSKIEGFKFIENYFYGLTLNQQHFDEKLYFEGQ